MSVAAHADSSTPPRVPLSRDRVLRAAIDMADESGIESLTMRKLALALGVEAMSLYHYVASKDDILGGMVDIVVGEMDLPSAEADWRSAMRRSAISAHEVLVRHPWAANLLLSGPTVSQPRLRHMDAILGYLRRGGFSAEMTDHAYHALDSHIMGFTLWQVGISAGMSRLGSVSTFLESFPIDEMPHLAEHIEQHLKERSPEDEGEFAYGLDLILDGLERIRAKA
jgi:AcrR family transcriptional regulator